MIDEQDDFKRVRSIVYAFRSNHAERRPSATQVIAIMRALSPGKRSGMERGRACAALKKFYQEEDAQTAPRPTQTIIENDETEEDLQRPILRGHKTEEDFQEPTSDAEKTLETSCADQNFKTKNKLPTVTATPAPPKQESLLGDEEPPKKKTAAKGRRRDSTAKSQHGPRPEHFILDAVGSLIQPHLAGMTIGIWRRNNANAARDMVEAGVTSDSAAEIWLSEFERTGVPIIMLKWLQERIANAAARGVKHSHMPSNDNLPTIEDDIAALRAVGTDAANARADEMEAKLAESDRQILLERAASGFVPHLEVQHA